MGSTMSQSYEAALEMRRLCLNVNLKVRSQHSRIRLFIRHSRLIAPPVQPQALAGCGSESLSDLLLQEEIQVIHAHCFHSANTITDHQHNNAISTRCIAAGCKMFPGVQGALRFQVRCLQYGENAVQTLPVIRDCMDSFMLHLEDTKNLLTSLQALMTLLSPGSKTVRCFVVFVPLEVE